jgi:hypothetical protein
MKNNASLDKFCKIKAKKEEKHKKSATNGAEEIAGNGNWGVEEEKHKMGDDNKGGKLHDFRCPRIRHCPRLSHAGIQQPFPPSSNLFKISPGGIRIIQNCFPNLACWSVCFARARERWMAGVVYRIEHLLFLPGLLLPTFRRAARVAASKTSRTPSLVRAEHSRYL